MLSQQEARPRGRSRPALAKYLQPAALCKGAWEPRPRPHLPRGMLGGILGNLYPSRGSSTWEAPQMLSAGEGLWVSSLASDRQVGSAAAGPKAQASGWGLWASLPAAPQEEVNKRKYLGAGVGR